VFFLLTFHGKFVGFHDETWELRQTDISDGTPNLVIEIIANEGRLYRRGTDGALGKCPGLPFRIRHKPDDLITIEQANLLLCALPDGAVVTNRHVADAWESFRLLSQDELSFLLSLYRHGAYSTTLSYLLTPGSIRPAPEFMLSGGPMSFHMRSFSDALAGRRASKLTLDLHFDGWKLERLRLFRPLIYVTAFGHPLIFECMRLMLQSLVTFGDYRGEVAIITDRVAGGVLEHVPAELRGGTHVLNVPAFDALDFTIARYRIADLIDTSIYQPILSLDTDIVCNAPITPLLLDVARADRLCLAREGDLFASSHFWGATLIEQDTAATAALPDGLNTGVLGIPNHHIADDVFPAILRTRYEYSRTTGIRHPLPAEDQPFTNYVVHKLKAYDTTAFVDRVVNAKGQFDRPFSEYVRCGLVHFCGGIGNAAPKHMTMTAYIDYLNETGGDEAKRASANAIDTLPMEAQWAPLRDRTRKPALWRDAPT